jgi:hypothetical protein
MYDDQNLDSRARVHLEWMFERQPELVRQLHQQGKLREHLEEKYQQGLRMVDRLKSQGGMSEEEAFQAAMEAVLAPPREEIPDEDPEPVPLKEQEQILRSLD